MAKPTLKAARVKRAPSAKPDRIVRFEQRLPLVPPLLDHPIFIAGRGRSGTSLLLRLIDGHKPVFPIPNESRLFTQILPDLRKTGDLEAAKRVIGERFLPDSPVVADHAKAHLDHRIAGLDANSPMIARDLLEIILELACYKDNPIGAKHFVEKTPKNEEHLPALFQAFPTAKVIYMVRDPRGVYLSNRRSETFQMEPAEMGRQWAKSVKQLLLHAATTKLTGSVFLIRYEDLVTQPRLTMRELCKFLGLRWSEELTKPTWLGRPWHGNSYAEEENSSAEVRAARAHDWRNHITAAESEGVVSSARFEMSLLKYPLWFRETT